MHLWTQSQSQRSNFQTCCFPLFQNAVLSNAVLYFTYWCKTVVLMVLSLLLVISPCTQTHINTQMNTLTHIYMLFQTMYSHARTHTGALIHIHTHTHTHTERETEREREREREREVSFEGYFKLGRFEKRKE